MIPELVIVGPSLVDEIHYLESNKRIQAGGSALYTTLGAALVGINVGVVTIWGNDYPKQISDNFKSKKNINLTGIKRLNQPSCLCVINSDASDVEYDYQSGVTNFETICPQLANLPKSFLQAEIIHISPFVADLQIKLIKSLTKYFKNRLSLDPVEQIPSSIIMDYYNTLQYIDNFLPSEREYDLFTSNKDYKVEMPKFIHGKLQHIILKRAAAGCLYYNSSLREFIEEPACLNFTFVDANGAGDTFCGAFNAALIKYNDYAVALKLATIAASFTIEGAGPERLLAVTPEEYFARVKTVYPNINLEYKVI